MIPPRNILITVTAAAFGLIPIARAVPPSTIPADSIRQASDPSAAVAAFIEADRANPQNTDIEQAFVHRMVELGAPELADAQARDLLNRNAADAVTRGVCAYMDASRGKASTAIPMLLAALTELPDNDFLLRTAAQMCAWYDTQNDRSSLSKTETQGIESLRAKGKGKAEFESAYQEAYDARRRVITTPTATENLRIPTPPSAISSSPYDATSVADRYVYPPPIVYSEPSYVYPPYPYYDYYWPGSIIILRDCDFRHHASLNHTRFFPRSGFDRNRFGPPVVHPTAPLISPGERVSPRSRMDVTPPRRMPAPAPPSRVSPREQFRSAPQSPRPSAPAPSRGGQGAARGR